MAAKKATGPKARDKRIAAKKTGEVINFIDELRTELAAESANGLPPQKQEEVRQRRAKQPTAIVPTMLRLREDLRKRLEREASKHAISLNAEMVKRLRVSLGIDEHLEREREIMRLGLRRETALIEALIGDKMIAAFLRSVAQLMMHNPNWAETEQDRQAMAQAINRRLDLIDPSGLRTNSPDETFDFESPRLPPPPRKGDKQ